MFLAAGMILVYDTRDWTLDKVWWPGKRCVGCEWVMGNGRGGQYVRCCYAPCPPWPG